MVLGNVFQDVPNAKIILYMFRTSQMTFIQSEHVKLDKTWLETQGHFKESFSKVMDVVGRLTSKHHET